MGKLSIATMFICVAALGCGSEQPFEGVYHPIPDGGLADANNHGGTSALDGTATTNLPGATIRYVGSDPEPGFTFEATHLELTSSPAGVTVEFLARLHNDAPQARCQFDVDASLHDLAGNQLIDLNVQADLELYVDPALDLSTTCVGANSDFYIHATDFLTGASVFELDDVRGIEWQRALRGSLADRVPATNATVTNLQVVPSPLGDWMITGTLSNTSTETIRFPTFAAYVLNRGGQPLARLSDSSSASLAPSAAWMFQANHSAIDFALTDVAYVISFGISPN